MPEENQGLNPSTWSVTHEKILIDWADKAMCYRWMHARSHQVFAKKNAWFTIPVIIMSTVTGTVTLAQPRFPEHLQDMVAIGTGVINIFAGILTTVQQFLKIGELNEAHRACGISWDKFARNVKIELAKCPAERTNPQQLLKAAKEEYDRLMETSPPIRNDVIRLFNATFPEAEMPVQETEGSERPSLRKPEVCNAIFSVEEYLYNGVGAAVDDGKAAANEAREEAELEALPRAMRPNIGTVIEDP